MGPLAEFGSFAGLSDLGCDIEDRALWVIAGGPLSKPLSNSQLTTSRCHCLSSVTGGPAVGRCNSQAKV